MGRASFSTAAYQVSGGVSFLLMYVTGCSSPLVVCDTTAPRPVSEASVWRVKGQEKSGACRTRDEERAAFRRWNASLAAGLHCILSGLPFLVRSVRAQANEVKDGMKHR